MTLPEPSWDTDSSNSQRGHQPPARLEGGQRSWLEGAFWSSWQCQGEPSPGDSLGQAGFVKAVPGCWGIPLHAGRSSHLPLWSGVSHQLCVVSCNSNKVFLFNPRCASTHTKPRSWGNRREGKFRFDGFRLSFTLAVSNAFSELSSWAA